MKGKKKAVTLLELLITSSIFVMVMVTIYSAFYTGLFGFEDIEDNIDVYQTARLILDRINLDIRNSFVYSALETKFTGESNKFSLLCLVDTYDEGFLRQDYAFVSYELKDDKLMRLCRKNKDALNEESDTAYEEMSSNVEELRFSFGYIEENSQEIIWKDIWEDRAVMPLAIKTKLVLNDNIRQEFERTVFIPD